MIALALTEVRSFMNTLLMKDTFDRFFLEEAFIKKEYTVSIEGRTSDLSPYLPYGKMRPILMEHMKGEKVPDLLRITLEYPATAQMVARLTGGDDTQTKIKEFLMRIEFDAHGLRLVTGVSYETFSMEKDLEKAWDESVKRFLNEEDVAYEE